MASPSVWLKLTTLFIAMLDFPLLHSRAMAQTNTKPKPNLIHIVADDVGWASIKRLDKEMKTPVLNRMIRNGRQLKYNYVLPTCAPTRSALLTGKYPFTYGMQVNPISGFKQAWLDHRLTLLPETLRDLGYKTHMIGKWHLGFCNKTLTPLGRGFDTFYGFYSGAQGYFNHSGNANHTYDFRDDDDIVWNAKGKYATTLHTNRALRIIRKSVAPFYLYLAYQNAHAPFEADSRDLKACKNVTPEKRRTNCAMVKAVDRGIGRIIDTLNKTNKLDNTFIVFMSDNGGPLVGGSYNYPLRGQKSTLWEGGTRSFSVVYSNLLQGPVGKNCSIMMHAVDWFPTLVQAAGGNTSDMGLDGKGVWENLLTCNKTGTRTSFIYNIDDANNRSAIRMRKWKLIIGKPGRKYNGWYPFPSSGLNTTDIKKIGEEHLYDISADPEERNNLYNLTIPKYRNIIKTMTKMLNTERGRLRPYTQSNSSREGFMIARSIGAYSPGWCDPNTNGYWADY